MINWVTFSILSIILYIPFTLILWHWHTRQWRVPIIGNNGAFILLTVVICGFYGIIFKGGTLIEEIHLIRSEALTLAASFFAFLYGGTLVKLIPKEKW